MVRFTVHWHEEPAIMLLSRNFTFPSVYVNYKKKNICHMRLQMRYNGHVCPKYKRGYVSVLYSSFFRASILDGCR